MITMVGRNERLNVVGVELEDSRECWNNSKLSALETKSAK